ncbi:MAG: hypothetical protein K2F65_00875, partial [Eubacterium sp.]|nr:hypothetical protein [Eubacterium sp.]
MKKTKSLIAFLLAVVLVVSQCVVLTSYAFASDDESENGVEATTAVENAENEEESQADKIIIGIDGYDFLGDEPYQTLAAEYGAELDDVPFPETLPASIDGISEMVKLPVEWKLADGEEWDADGDVYDEDGNLVSSKIVADFGEGYVLSEELEDGEMPWINLIHQPKPVAEKDAEDNASAQETTKAETKVPVKTPSKAPAMLSNNVATYASLPASQQSTFVWYDTTVNAFNIRGVNNGSANIKVTFSESGFACVFRVDGKDSTVTFGGNGVTKTINGMNITQTLSIVNDGAYVKINYDVNNPTSVAHTIGIANHTDVMIGSNDKATIESTGTGALMSEATGNNSQFNMICKNAYGVTDVDTLWYGHYNSRQSNLWSTSVTAPLTNTDSGIAISWHDRVINPGQTRSYSYLLGVGKSANPPEISGEISAVVKPQTVDVSANVKDVTGMVDRLYYVLDMGTSDETDPAVLDTKNGNGSFQSMGGSIARPKSWQAGEVHTVSVWVMNNANAMSPIKTVAILIEDNEDLGDVMRPAQSAT